MREFAVDGHVGGDSLAHQSLDARGSAPGLGRVCPPKPSQDKKDQEMRKQPQFARQRLLQEQSDQYLNESELPFTVPPVPARR
jgi:hypothetical protein